MRDRPMAVETLVLVVEPDPAYARLLRVELESHGFRVLHAPDGNAALSTVEKVHPDLVAVATQLPDGPGVTFMISLHARLDVPVILLASGAGDPERLRGLMLGADDCASKPFDPQEFAARVSAVLRRARRSTAGPAAVAEGLQLDFRHRVARIDGALVQLNATDWRLLELLVSRSGRVLPVAELLAAVWGQDPGADAQRLRVVMSRLRIKLGSAGWVLQTARGEGYRFDRRQLADAHPGSRATRGTREGVDAGPAR